MQVHKGPTSTSETKYSFRTPKVLNTLTCLYELNTTSSDVKVKDLTNIAYRWIAQIDLQATVLNMKTFHKMIKHAELKDVVYILQLKKQTSGHEKDEWLNWIRLSKNVNLQSEESYTLKAEKIFRPGEFIGLFTPRENRTFLGMGLHHALMSLKQISDLPALHEAQFLQKSLKKAKNTAIDDKGHVYATKLIKKGDQLIIPMDSDVEH